MDEASIILLSIPGLLKLVASTISNNIATHINVGEGAEKEERGCKHRICERAGGPVGTQRTPPRVEGRMLQEFAGVYSGRWIQLQGGESSGAGLCSRYRDGGVDRRG